MVTGVKPGSVSDTIGIQEGDVILEANGLSVNTVDDLKKALKKGSDNIVLLIWRDGRTFFVSLRL